MSKTKKTYSREFKLKVVQTVEAGELRPAQACREYQIAESVLTRWRREVRLRGAEAAFTSLTGANATPERPNQPSQTERDVALRDAIERIVLEFPGYGYRRVTAELHRQNWEVNHKRALRIMCAEALLCQLQRSWVTTTDSRHELRTYPNLLAGLVLDRPNQAWVADITYVRLPTCFIYLACVLDAWSRQCVGWQLSSTIDTQLTLAALNHAIALRRPQLGLIHHSDRGVQYASTAYVERLSEIGAQVSMSAKGNPYDNAKAESFFKTLKREEVYLNQYETFADAEAQLGRFIDDLYNLKRLHSSLGYLPPVEYESLYNATEEHPSPVVR